MLVSHLQSNRQNVRDGNIYHQTKMLLFCELQGKFKIGKFLVDQLERYVLKTLI